MASLRSIAIIFLSFVALSAQQSNGASEGITCYDWDGGAYSNNTQCPGSHVCCKTADLCTPNRFCVANGQTIVPPCAVYPWSDCSNICQYVTGTGFLPRVVTCSDGSFCCDNDPKCCAENRGIVLNGLGAIVSTDDGIISTSTSTSTSTSMSSTTTYTSTSTNSVTTSNSPTASITSPLNTATSSPPLAISTPLESPLPQPDASSSTGLTFTAKIGIGIGACGAVAILAVVAFPIWCRRRRSRNAKARPMTVLYSHELGHAQAAPATFSMPYTQQIYSHPVEKPAAGSELHEMPGQNTPRI